MNRITKQLSYVVLSLVLGISSILTGCAVKDPVAQDVLTNTMAAMEKMTSYKADYDLKMDMEMSGSQEDAKMTMDASGVAVTEVKSQKTQMTMDMNMNIPGEDAQQISVEIYSVEGWQYYKIEVPGEDVQWMKKKNPNVLSSDQVSQLTALMKTSTESTLLEKQTINGINCYVLAIEPDMAALLQWLMSQQASELTSGMDFSKFDLSKIVKSFGVKYWIAKKNYQLIKTEADMNMFFDAETLGLSPDETGSMTMSMMMAMSFSDFNKPVNIEVPIEALNTEEVPQ